MNIVFIQRVLPIYRQSLFDELRKQSLTQGHQFALWVSKPNSAFTKRVAAGALEWVDWVHCVSLPKVVGAIEFQLLPWRKLLEADVVIVPDNLRCLSNLVVLVLRRFLGRPVISWGYGGNFQPTHFSMLFAKLRLWLLRMANCNLVCTEACLPRLLDAGFSLDRLGVTENAIDTTDAQGLYPQHLKVLLFRQKYNLGNYPCIVFLGSWYARKRPEIVIEIGEALRKQIPEARIMVIGGGDGLSVLQSRAANNSWLVLTGPLYGQDKFIALAAADCLVVSGVAGLNLLDAMAVGLPVVLPKRADHNPEVAYVEHNVNGLIVEDTVRHISDACVEIISNPVKRAFLSDGSFATSSDRTIEGMAAKFLVFAQEAVFPRSKQPVVFLYQRMLPYHQARFTAVAEALAGQGKKCLAVEVANFDRSYGAINTNAENTKNRKFPIECLFPGKDYLDLDNSIVAAKVALRLYELTPDLVFSPAPAFAEGAGAMRYKVRHGGRLILMDDAWGITERRSKFKRIVKRLLYRCYDGGFFPSQLHGEYFSQLSIPFDRQRFALDVVGDIDITVCEETTAKCTLQKPYLLFVGRLIRRKGLDVLIRAFSRLQHDNLTLVVIGDGSEREEFEAAARQLGVQESIEWLGSLDNITTRTWMLHCTALVVPSEFEQWGLVVNEAWEAGTLVLGSDTVGALKSGYQVDMSWLLSPPRDAEALKNSLEKVLALSSSERAQLLAKLAIIQSDFSMDEHVKSALELVKIIPRKRVDCLTYCIALAWKGNVVVW